MKLKAIKKFYLFFLLFISSFSVYAQNVNHDTKIAGTLSDENGGHLDYASVTLLKAKDSSVVKGTLSNETGIYNFDHVLSGSYMIKASEVGYKTVTSAVFTLADTATTLTLPVLTLRTVRNTLGTVTISAFRPLIERQSDRTVMNVESSILAAGNNALEILARAPGVSIDQNDNISLNGKQGVTVMINDKLTYLSTAQLATLLKSTDGATIHSIEIITNPSAKYDASGNAGIINIKLKVNKQTGTGGSVILGAGYGAGIKDRETIILNHKEGNLSLFGNFSHDDSKEKQFGDTKRVVTDPEGNNTYFNQLSTGVPFEHDNSYRFGADCELSTKNTIGFAANGDFNTPAFVNNSFVYIGNQPNIVSSYQNTLAAFTQDNSNFALNLNDKYKIDTIGQELSVDLDYSKFDTYSSAQYNTSFFLPDGSIMAAPEALRQQTPATVLIHSLKTDYTLPLNKRLKIETGVKFSDVKSDNNLLAQQLVTKTYLNDTTLTNHFIYDEKIEAGYINLNQSFKNTTFQVGLRAEHTSSAGDLVTTGQEVSRHYLNIFPSIFLNHTINDKNQLGFSYGRRIDRPEYSDLNPFIYYSDQYSYTSGNPFLRPQYTNKFELNYTYNKSINISLGFSHTSDAITELILTDAVTKITDQTQVNLKSQDHYDVNVFAPYTISNWWNGNVNCTLFYLQSKADSLLGGNLNRGKLAYLLKATQSFTVGTVFKAELTSSYRSELTSGIYDVRPRYSTDIGVSHTFDDKKMNLKLSVTDIFNTSRDLVSSNYQTNNISIDQKLESRVTRLTLTYNFGSNKIKSREHESGAEDLKNRAK